MRKWFARKSPRLALPCRSCLPPALHLRRAQDVYDNDMSDVGPLSTDLSNDREDREDDRDGGVGEEEEDGFEDTDSMDNNGGPQATVRAAVAALDHGATPQEAEDAVAEAAADVEEPATAADAAAAEEMADASAEDVAVNRGAAAAYI